MARQPRFDLPSIAQHVVRRGNNRLPCFLDDLDRQRYLQCLRQALGRFGCRLHAYVLMSNHVHLLLTPDGLTTGEVKLPDARFSRCFPQTSTFTLPCFRFPSAFAVVQP
ncbi:transposase [Rhodanobacter ginsenosidimutans]|uniref:Transposase n=1 Tax=Rhodanobacter ginsenosidimutans TaxID=490571 RepID=A0ABW0JV89_9GAMM